MLITLEGTDGSGKSSAARLLAEALGFRFASTPGDEFISIRKAATLSRYSAYYYYLSSCYYVSELAKNADVVCDRFIHSTIAYNWPFTEKRPADLYAYFEGLYRPERSFLLCASEGVRRERMSERARTGVINSELDSDFAGQERAQRVYMSYPELVQIHTDSLSLEEVVKLMVNEVKRV